MSDINEKLILSVGDQRIEFNLDDFIQTLDEEISGFKKEQNTTDNIRIISTNGQEKIYINCFNNDILETGLSNTTSIIKGYSEDEQKVKQPASSLKEMVKRNNVTKKSSENIWEENPFTNRKQRLGSTTSKSEKIPFDTNTLTKMLDSSKKNQEKRTENNVISDYKVVELQPKTEDLHLNLEKANNDFEDGLSVMLAKMATEKLHDLELSPEERIIKCKDYCTNILYPLFTHLKQELSGYNRSANINFNLDLLKISIEIRYRNKLEYDYEIQIKNPAKSPVLQVKTSDIKNQSGQLIIRDSLTDISISCVSKEDIFQDFLRGYKKHLYSSFAG